MVNAFRNLTNRVEDAVGDYTNLHMTFPALVFGFLFMIRASREGPLIEPIPRGMKPDEHGNIRTADVAVTAAGDPTGAIKRFHDSLSRLANRTDMRNTVSRYESVALTLVSPDDPPQIMSAFPPAESQLRFADFFERLYAVYDQRYVYAVPTMARTTRRLEWDPASPVLTDERCAEYEPRIAAE